MIKVLFLGTPEFACPTLDALLANSDAFEVVGVVTQPDRPAGRNLELTPSRVKQLAEAHLGKLGKGKPKFPVIGTEDVNQPDVLQQISKLGAEIAVVVAFGQILKAPFLKMFPLGAVNVHASLLPQYRGAAPIAWALLNREPITGVTLQKIALKLDSGDILAQTQSVLDDETDAPVLYNELSKRGADLVRKNLAEFVAGKLVGKPQNAAQVSIAPKIKKEQGLIDWAKTASDICAQIRALTPWPGTWSTRKGKSLKILRAKAIEYKGGEPGFVISVDKHNFVVQCGGGTALMVTVVQPESRARQPVAEYLKGYPFVKGDRFGS
jgi:methionyl-tRNA formyltransferase